MVIVEISSGAKLYLGASLKTQNAIGVLIDLRQVRVHKMAEMTASEAIGLLKTCNYFTPQGRKAIAALVERQQAEIAKLKDEILRCRTKEVHMDGTTYGTINASQVFRIHEMVRKEAEVQG